MVRSGTHTKRVWLRTTAKEHRRLKIEAAQTGKTVAEIVTTAIEYYLSRSESERRSGDAPSVR